MRFVHITAAATLLGLTVLGFAKKSHADEGIGIGAKVGTLGLGVELSTSLLPTTRLRGGFNYLSYSFDSTISDIDYEFEPEFNSFSLLLDWHPFSGSFFLSGGVYLNNNSVGVTGSAPESLVPAAYSDFAYLTNELSISGEVEFLPVAPYAGLGWRSNSGESGWGVAVELGVLFQGAPDVQNLRINAPVDVNQVDEVQSFLAGQEQEIEDELSKFEFYPVAAAMLTYHF
jgi:hypothetical protein